MPRDEFTPTTKATIARRAGYRCSHPACRLPTAAPDADEGAISIGVAAHIHAAAENGPRHDATMTQDQRRAASNGIWLCQNHAREIDVDIPGHPAVLLHLWRTQAGARATAALRGEAPSTATVTATVFLRRGSPDQLPALLERFIEHGEGWVRAPWLDILQLRRTPLALEVRSTGQVVDRLRREGADGTLHRALGSPVRVVSRGSPPPPAAGGSIHVHGDVKNHGQIGTGTMTQIIHLPGRPSPPRDRTVTLYTSHSGAAWDPRQRRVDQSRGPRAA